MRAHEGDVVRMRTPAGEEEIEILRVEYIRAAAVLGAHFGTWRLRRNIGHRNSGRRPGACQYFRPGVARDSTLAKMPESPAASPRGGGARQGRSIEMNGHEADPLWASVGGIGSCRLDVKPREIRALSMESCLLPEVPERRRSLMVALQPPSLGAAQASHVEKHIGRPAR